MKHWQPSSMTCFFTYFFVFLFHSSASASETKSIVPEVLQNLEFGSAEIGAQMPSQIFMVSSKSLNERRMYVSFYGFDAVLLYALNARLFLQGSYGLSFAEGTTVDSRYGASVRYAMLGGAPQNFLPARAGGLSLRMKPTWSVLVGCGMKSHSVDLRPFDNSTLAAQAFGKQLDQQASLVTLDAVSELRLYTSAQVSLGLEASYGEQVSSSSSDLSVSIFRLALGMRSWL